MRQRSFLFFVIVGLAVSALRGDGTPTVDLFAGYAWWPYFWSPAVGVGDSILRPYDPYFCGYPYGPYWGYGVHYRLRSDRCLFLPQKDTQPVFPGTAPTELLSTEPTTAWDQRLATFLAADAPTSETKTNTVPRQAVSAK